MMETHHNQLGAGIDKSDGIEWHFMWSDCCPTGLIEIPKKKKNVGNSENHRKYGRNQNILCIVAKVSFVFVISPFALSLFIKLHDDTFRQDIYCVYIFIHCVQQIVQVFFSMIAFNLLHLRLRIQYLRCAYLATVLANTMQQCIERRRSKNALDFLCTYKRPNSEESD